MEKKAKSARVYTHSRNSLTNKWSNIADKWWEAHRKLTNDLTSPSKPNSPVRPYRRVDFQDWSNRTDAFDSLGLQMKNIQSYIQSLEDYLRELKGATEGLDEVVYDINKLRPAVKKPVKKTVRKTVKKLAKKTKAK